MNPPSYHELQWHPSLLFQGALALCLMAQPLSAAQFEKFTYYIDNGTSITITKYTGSDNDVSIPGTINGLSVNCIEKEAFSYCTSLTAVTIPASVTSIGNAFGFCKSLTAITVDAGNPAYCSVDGVLFNKGLTTLIKYPDGKAGRYTIPTSVTSTGELAFASCSNLSSVMIPASVISNEFKQFQGCTSLTSIVVDATNPCYSSNDGVLFDKSQTTLVQFPKGKAGRYTIPASITSIRSGAFHYCRCLTSITIPASVTSINIAEFLSCSSLTVITVDSDNPAYSSVDGVLFNKGLTTLVKYPEGKAESYIIPASVISIRDSAFRNCRSLTSVTIPASVTEIGHSAFNSCTSLTSAIFMGNALPMYSDVFDQTGSGFTVYYSKDKSGFTSPIWEGYPAVGLPRDHTNTTAKGPVIIAWITVGLAVSVILLIAMARKFRMRKLSAG